VPSSPGTRVADNQAFFGARAATWEDRFPDDEPRYALAVSQLAPVSGGVAVDVGCGTGRALPFLAAAVGADGVVVGVDVTVEMLQAALDRGRPGALVLADASLLPFADRSCDAIFSAGLLHHLPDPDAGLREFARVSSTGARLALFHPIGRAALAARHGTVPAPEDIRGPARLESAMSAAGWQLEFVDDSEDRYLVVAVRG
jgi:SAM-dependent methyltransferase